MTISLSGARHDLPCIMKFDCKWRQIETTSRSPSYRQLLQHDNDGRDELGHEDLREQVLEVRYEEVVDSVTTYDTAVQRHHYGNQAKEFHFYTEQTSVKSRKRINYKDVLIQLNHIRYLLPQTCPAHDGRGPSPEPFINGYN
jgi:hypothetical protein